MAKLYALNTLHSQQAAEHVTATMHVAQKWVAAVCALITVFGIVLAFVITRVITHPLREAVAVAETVAAGDLTSRIEVKSQDETGQLLRALRRMNENLMQLIDGVRTSADSISSASQQIASGVQRPRKRSRR